MLHHEKKKKIKLIKIKNFKLPELGIYFEVESVLNSNKIQQNNCQHQNIIFSLNFFLTKNHIQGLET